jgi:hypothetical protein
MNKCLVLELKIIPNIHKKKINFPSTTTKGINSQILFGTPPVFIWVDVGTTSKINLHSLIYRLRS